MATTIGSLRLKAKLISSWIQTMLGPRRDSFDYEFSGLSVWLEPDTADAVAVKNSMAQLAEVCGGPSRGLHAFEPHCTMLYNIPSNKFLLRGERISPNSSSAQEEDDGDELKRTAQDLLDQCLQEYKTRVGQDVAIDLVPDSLNVFRYPPFRCAITFLHLATTPALVELHQTLLHVFPSDERHDKGGSLMPHMSLVYAPESQDEILFDETQRIRNDPTGQLLLRPMRARYLSVWSTEGRTCDWKRLAKVELLLD